MRTGGRVRLAGIFHLVCLYASIDISVSNEYGVPIEIKLWDTGRTPLAHMVDVTNGFGLKVLAEHNFLNDNNIAFSPYGLMGILVALYEGVDGESSYQIQRGMQLPWNRNVMRIGFRDIHRTLKTYFVPEEGFLAGLALNNENVTFNEGYKKILRFYGFDLDSDQLPTLPPSNSTNNETTTSAPAMATTSDPTTAGAMTTENMPTREGTSSTSAREETTPNPNAETLNDLDIRGPSTTTISPSLAPNAESTTDITVPSTVAQNSNTEQASTVTETVVSMITEASQQSSTNEITTTTIVPTVDIGTQTPTTPMAETEAIGPPTSSVSTAAFTNELTVNNEVDILTTPSMSSTVAESTSVDTSTIASSTQTETESVMTSVANSEQTEGASISTTDMTTSSDVLTTPNNSTLETLERKKKSIVDFIFTNPPYVDDYLIYRSYDIPIVDGPNNKFDGENNFLANGLRNVLVTYMQYDTVLEHAYLPHLEASALRLPLDSERYYLLVVLPTRGGAPELGRLLSRMARESDLSDVYSALRPRRVRAIVPSFTVKGHVTLTTDLQKLGIRDVFEPRQRDFTPMTHQAGVYVRSIEQAVSVAIRKYRPDDNKKNRYVTNRQPVMFSATYPFLYFVMDSSIHVALMAGKMVDPLNTRIL